MEPYRHTPGWSAFVESCPELALSEDSDDEDWRASLAKVKAKPADKASDTAASEVSVAAEGSVAPPASLPTLPSATSPSAVATPPATTSRSGPVPRPVATLSAARAPSVPSVRILEPTPPVSLPVASSTADPDLVSDGSEDEEEDEAAADESEEDEIVDHAAGPEDAEELDDEEERPVEVVTPKPRKGKRAIRGSRQVAKDFPTEITPEDTPLGAYRAGADLVVRCVHFSSSPADIRLCSLVRLLPRRRGRSWRLYPLCSPTSRVQALLRQQSQM